MKSVVLLLNYWFYFLAIKTSANTYLNVNGPVLKGKN